MSKTRILDGIEIEETDDRFETYGVILNEADNKIHHDRVSVKYDDDEVASIAIQPFVDESTPHGYMGTQIDPERIGDLITYLELIEANL